MEPVVGLLTVELYIADAMTLKDKRSVVSSLLHRLGNKFNVAVAEIAALDVHRRAIVSVVTVANDRQFVSRVLESALSFIESEPRAEVHDVQTEYI